VETAVYSHDFAKFLAAFTGRRPEINKDDIYSSHALCSEVGFEEFLTTLQAFDAPPSRAGGSSIKDESHNHVHDDEEQNLQHLIRLLTILSLEQDRQESGTFSPLSIMRAGRPAHGKRFRSVPHLL
jgi:hypothetical protein